MERIPLAAIAAVAISTGVVLHFDGSRVPLIGFQLLTAFGSLLITLAIHLGGRTGLAYSFFYVWVAAWAFYWLTPRVAWLEMGWLALISAVDLVRVNGARDAALVAFVYWATMVITACTTGLLLAYLVERRARDRDQLSWRRQQLTDVMAGLPLSVFALDPDGVVSLVEGPVLDLLPSGATELVGRTIFDIVAQDHPLADAARRALRGEEALGAVSIGEQEFDFRMTPMYETDGRLTRISGILVDVTEIRRLEHDAMERQAREKFLARVSHELRTPLNSVLGFLQLLEASGSALPDKQRHYVQRARRAAHVQLDLVNELLDLQKLRSAELTFDIATVSISDVVNDAATIAQVLADSRGIQLLVEAAPLVFATDSRRLGQVLLNLLSNAIKFSPAGSQVRLRAAVSDGHLLVQVIDHGPGLAPQDQERIFEEFYQAGDGASANEGTGLGLSISRQIARRLGGDINVQSILGGGATFTVSLPLKPYAVEAAAP